MTNNDQQTEAAKRYDTTVRGGRYTINGKTVDANGQPIKQTKSNTKPQDHDSKN